MRGTTFATAGLGVLGVFIVGSLGWDAAQMASAASPTRSPATVVQGGTEHIFLTIATPHMLGTEIGPALMPSSLNLPAHSDVVITITNFDDATALPAGSEQYANAEGLSGPMSIQAMDPANPNALGTATTATRLDPSTGVSHTFTVAKLGISIPVAPRSRTTVTLHTGAAGSYQWQCMDPCGTGPTGWDGAMSTKGYMTGQVSACDAGGCCCG
jgi:hypothetical protein